MVKWTNFAIFYLQVILSWPQIFHSFLFFILYSEVVYGKINLFHPLGSYNTNYISISFLLIIIIISIIILEMVTMGIFAIISGPH